jgi:hypothetical protein
VRQMLDRKLALRVQQSQSPTHPISERRVDGWECSEAFQRSDDAT